MRPVNSHLGDPSQPSVGRVEYCVVPARCHDSIFEDVTDDAFEDGERELRFGSSSAQFPDRTPRQNMGGHGAHCDQRCDLGKSVPPWSCVVSPTSIAAVAREGAPKQS